MNYTQIVKKVIFVIAVVYLLLALYTITLGQSLPYEFIDSDLKNKFYNVLGWGTPIAVLLTLLGTIKPRHSRLRKSITIAVSLLMIPLFGFYLFSIRLFGQAEWRTTSVVYVHRDDSQHRIERQFIDYGLSNDRRLVEIQPFSSLFNKITSVQHLPRNNSNWILVEED